MTSETLYKSQRSFGLPVGLLMALYCLFNPSIISVWLSLSFLGLTVDSYEYHFHVFYWWPLWKHSNRDSRKKERNLFTFQHIKISILILHIHFPYNIFALLNPGVKWFLLGQNLASRSFLVGKMSHELGEKLKKYSRKHPFSDRFWRVSFEKRYGFLWRFSNENVRSSPIRETGFRLKINEDFKSLQLQLVLGYFSESVRVCLMAELI